MKRTMTVKENYEFRRIYAKGRSGVSPYLVVYVRPNRRGRNRLGVTVSTKLGPPPSAGNFPAEPKRARAGV